MHKPKTTLTNETDGVLKSQKLIPYFVGKLFIQNLEWL